MFFLACTSNNMQLSTEHNNILDFSSKSKGIYVVQDNKMYINISYSKGSIVSTVTTTPEDVFNIYLLVNITDNKIDLKSAQTYFGSMGVYRFENGKLKINQLRIQKLPTGEYSISSMMEGNAPNRGPFSIKINKLNLKKVTSHEAFVKRLNAVDRSRFLDKKFRAYINPS
jgi:hypothetical protein